MNRIIMTAQQAAEWCGGVLYGDPNAEITSIVIDSRSAVPGCMFVGLRGENTDGNNYLEKAIEAGASCVLSERVPESGCAVVTNDSLKALQDIASRYMDTVSPRVFAVTGSVGKTTTKQFIASALSASMRVQKTEGNLNSIIGLPMMVLTFAPDCEAAVLEMGMSGAGEIRTMTNIARPDVAVITNIGTSHMEILGSRENILRAKLEITEGLKSGGYLLLNGDDRMLWEAGKSLSGDYKVIYYSAYNEECDYRAENIKLSGTSLSFDLLTPNGKTVCGITAPTFGMHNVYNATVAYICGVLCGMDTDAIKRGIASFENTGMRQKVYKKGSYTVMCDCYNAAPESMKAAFSALVLTVRENGGRTHALLGEMKELGAMSPALHRQVGRAAYEAGVNFLYTYGEAAKEYAAGALEAGMREDRIISFGDGEAMEIVAEAILDKCDAGDCVLFKASRTVALERAVEAFEKAVDEKA